MTPSRLVPAAAAVALALGLSGCSLISDVYGSLTGQSDVFSLAVGDCIAQMDETESFTTIPIVDCSEEHVDEAYYAFDLTGDTLPSEDELYAEADANCEQEFTSFVGIAYADSALEYWYLYPSEESWASGDREVMCLVYDPSASVTGTLSGAAR